MKVRHRTEPDGSAPLVTPSVSEARLGQESSWSSPVVVGTAGWAIPRAVAAEFLSEGTLLERYADRFDGVEINSTFYRSHRASTYARWRDAVPSRFRFAVKMPKAISHEKRLASVERELSQFLLETSELGERRGPLLLQLPPKFAFDELVAAGFFHLARTLSTGPMVIEPRHPSWFTPEAESLLIDFGIARVGADPPRDVLGMTPGGFRGLTYLRLHGAPRIYFSSYDDARLGEVAGIIRHSAGPCWCVLDNTASGAAASDALRLQGRLMA
jgi:uncharacterized protein YecE (DUF72 family)